MPSAAGWRSYPCSATGKPHALLCVDLTSRVIAKELPALLPALTEVRELAFASEDLVTAKHPAGCDKLCAELFSTLTSVRDVQAPNAHVPPAALPHLLCISQLTSLALRCARFNVREFNEILAPTVAQLAWLRQLTLSQAALLHRDVVSDGYAPANGRTGMFIGQALQKLTSLHELALVEV